MMIFTKIISLLSIIAICRGSLVIDSKSQGNINVNDFCPKMKHCPEGAHVLCMYEQNKMGPLCTDAKEIPLTRDKIQKILDVTNMIRSRIARGKERGKDDELLPRGYGIFRLKWDPVLSAFAQVLTNQCVLGHDFCRATHKFPDPSQIAGMFRYKVNWDPVKGKDLDFEPGFNNKKVVYALNRVLHSWYDHRTSVTPNHTTSFPDYDANPSEARGRLYLRMIYGSATHIGCGMTAYSQFNFKHDVKTNDGSFLLVICNLSASPHRGTSVFNTVPPGDTTVLPNPCGCPAGSMGDEMCLCVDAEDEPNHHKETDGHKRACTDGVDCDPALVVLPIFTVEDAPPDKLIHNKYMNTTRRKNGMDQYLYRSAEQRAWEDFNIKNTQVNVPQMNKPGVHETSRNDNNLRNNNNAKQYAPALRVVTPKQDFQKNPNVESSRISFFGNEEIIEKPKLSFFDKESTNQARKPDNLNKNENYGRVNSKYMDKNGDLNALRTKYIIKNTNLDAPGTVFNDKNHIEPQAHIEQHKSIQRVTRKKESIFSRPAKFHLPINLYEHIKPAHKIEIKDVVPRKDFSKAKQLLDKYLYDKHPIIKGNRIKSNQLPENSQNTYNKKSVTDHSNERTQDEQITVSTDRMHHVLSILRATKLKKSVDKTLSDKVTKTKAPSTENVLSKAERKVIKQAKFDLSVSKSNDYNGVVNKITEDADNRLMSLLDNLEQEIKHIELREKDKKLFDEKIRKIYGRVVGKPVNSINLNGKVTKPSNTRRTHDVRDSFLKKKSIQQEPEKTITERERTVKEGLDDQMSEPTYRMNDKYTNSSIKVEQYETEKFGERSLNKEIYDSPKRSYGDRPVSKNGDRPVAKNGDRPVAKNGDFEERHVVRDIDERKDRYDDNRYSERERYNDRDRDPDVRNEHRNVVGFDRGRTRSYHSRHENLMSQDRRQYYQDKLDNLERKLQMRRKMRKNTPAPHMRPLKSENQMDLYGRARFAHGY